MCGIWAAVGHGSLVDRTVAERALELVHHRGPDDQGLAQFLTPAGRVVLGNRRLAIQDTSSRARQPMSSADQALHLIFNGEILNFHQLFATIVGGKQRSASDTECLAEALRRAGLAVLEQIKGFFAFVAFDEQRQQLIVARDRFGIKPLYYWRSEQGFAFASEIKQFMALPDFSARLSPQALRDYIGLGLFDHRDGTFFDGIKQFRPGQAAILDLSGSAMRTVPFFWSRLPRYTEKMTRPDRLERLQQTLSNSVALGMASSVPIGIALSGGIDSSTVAVLAARKNTDQITSLIGVHFSEPSISEGHHALEVARTIGKPLLCATIDESELIELFEDAVWHFDEPTVRPSMLAQVKLYRAFRSQGLKVALNGQGGDELFCGYPFMISAWLVDAAREGNWAQVAGAFFRGFAQSQPAQIRRGLLTELVSPAFCDKALLGVGLGGCLAWPWLAGQLDLQRGRTRSLAAAASMRDLGWGGRLTALRHALLSTAHLPMLLHYEDRASMAAGVETRPVFLDHDLVDAAMSLPTRDILGGRRLKGALRAAMHGLLPAAIENRTDKLGFATPEEQWQKGPFGAWLRARALEGLEFARMPLGEIFSVDSMTERIARGEMRSIPIWALAGLGVWSQRFGVAA